jgi:catechol 2,3-dioxygenase-like lactoylglutathione lyase family enzyme
MSGIHHVTAISGKAARNLDFYTRTLGLRFVKKTVNFDDPGTYHLYYGDEVGHPGTILTFFPWEDAAPGRAGIGLAQQTAFRVPMSSIGFWTHRLLAKPDAERVVRSSVPASENLHTSGPQQNSFRTWQLLARTSTPPRLFRGRWHRRGVMVDNEPILAAFDESEAVARRQGLGLSILNKGKRVVARIDR